MLHNVRPNASPCAAEACLAVHRNGALGLFTGSNELFQDAAWRVGAVQVVEVQVVDANVCKALS